MSVPFVPLGQLAEIDRSGIPPGQIQAGTTYVGLENITEEGGFLGVKPVCNGELASTKFRFTRRHILYGKLRPYLRKIARPDFNGICSTDILPILPSDSVDRNYLSHYLRTDSAVSFAVTRSVGVNLPRISPTILETLPVPLPPLEEQRRLAAILDKAEALRAKRRQALAKLDTLPQSLFLEMFGDPIQNPKGWPIGTIEDLVLSPKSDIRCGPFGTQLKIAEIVDSGVPLYGIETAVRNEFDSNVQKFVSPIKAKQLVAFKALPGDVLVTRMGTIGRACVVPIGFPEGRFSYHLFRIRPDRKKCLPRFLATLISQSGIFLRQLEDFAHGAIMEGLSTQNLKMVRFPIPPTILQEKLVKCIDDLDHVKNRMNETKLAALLASLQHRAFRGEL